MHASGPVCTPHHLASHTGMHHPTHEAQNVASREHAGITTPCLLTPRTNDHAATEAWMAHRGSIAGDGYVGRRDMTVPSFTPHACRNTIAKRLQTRNTQHLVWHRHAHEMMDPSCTHFICRPRIKPRHCLNAETSRHLVHALSGVLLSVSFASSQPLQ